MDESNKMKQACPCFSGLAYHDCCEPYHKGKRPLTPLALMRSRYAAFSLGKVGFILKTQTKADHTVKARQELKQYCKTTQFVGLQILDAPEPTAKDGTVTFYAVCFQNGRDISFVEKSQFEKIKGNWRYTDGEARPIDKRKRY